MPKETIDALWILLLFDCNFLVLKDIVPKFLCMLGSTYVCESTFSNLIRRKNKFHNALSQKNLESEIRCEIRKQNADLNKLTENKECQPSH